jgi:hypothetical protein
MNPPGKRIPKPTKVSKSAQTMARPRYQTLNNFNLQPLIPPQPAQPKEVYPLLCTKIPRAIPLPFQGSSIGRPGSLIIVALGTTTTYNGVSRHPLGLTPRETYPKQFSLQGSSLPQGNPRRIVHPNPPRIHRVHNVTGLQWLTISHPISHRKNGKNDGMMDFLTKPKL